MKKKNEESNHPMSHLHNNNDHTQPNTIGNSSSDIVTPPFHITNKSQESECTNSQDLEGQEISLISDDDNGKIKPSPVIELRNDKIIKILQYINVIFALSGAIYFLCKNDSFITLEYIQISFISAIVVALDHEEKIIQRIALVILFGIGVFWGVLYTTSSYKTESVPLVSAISAASAVLFFQGGMTFVSYVITEISSPSIMKSVELDLILYLISLNAICFFSSNQHFNNNLHMILDIRTMVMLFSAIYQEKDKMKLVLIKDFVLIMCLIIVSFILYSFSSNPYEIFGNSIYVIIGSILWKEGYIAWIKYLRRKRKRSVAMAHKESRP